MPVRFALTALAPVVLVACAIGPAEPRQVALDANLLTVRMSDGSTCLGPAPSTGAEAGWSGRLQDCPWDYAYTVEIDEGTNPIRLILTEVFGEFGLLSPVADVTITDATGRDRVFQTPDRGEDG